MEQNVIFMNTWLAQPTGKETTEKKDVKKVPYKGQKFIVKREPWKGPIILWQGLVSAMTEAEQKVALKRAYTSMQPRPGLGFSWVQAFFICVYLCVFLRVLCACVHVLWEKETYQSLLRPAVLDAKDVELVARESACMGLRE